MPEYQVRIKLIQCPFFHHVNCRSIGCESLVRGGKSLCTRFLTEAQLRSHAEWHCYRIDGGGCEVYRALAERYEREPPVAEKK